MHRRSRPDRKNPFSWEQSEGVAIQIWHLREIRRKGILDHLPRGRNAFDSYFGKRQLYPFQTFHSGKCNNFQSHFRLQPGPWSGVWPLILKQELIKSATECCWIKAFEGSSIQPTRTQMTLIFYDLHRLNLRLSATSAFHPTNHSSNKRSITIHLFYSLTNSFVLLTVSMGRTSFSICARRGSKNGGNDNFSPRVS